MSGRTDLRCRLFGHRWDSFLTDDQGRPIRVCRRCNRWERNEAAK